MVGHARLPGMGLARTALGMERPRVGLAERVLDAGTGSGPNSATRAGNAAGSAAGTANSTSTGNAAGNGTDLAAGRVNSNAAGNETGSATSNETDNAAGTDIAAHLSVSARFVRFIGPRA